MIPLFKVFMSQSAAAAASAVLTSGFIGQGPVVEEFEEKLRGRFDHKWLVTLNSGTSGLHLALHMLRTQNGMAEPDPGAGQCDEVLTTALTCTATNWPILANGFRPRWVDIDPQTLNLDLDDLERKVGPRTRAIMLIHWGGYPIDLDRVSAIRRRAFEQWGRMIPVIEDCAHAFGSTYHGKPLGTTGHGHYAMYSFQAIKHFTTVDGGMLLLPTESGYRRAKLLRWYGIDRDGNRKDFRCEEDIPQWGFKFHMNDVCAAIGLENLKEVNGVIQAHRDNAAFYDRELAGIPGLTLLKRYPERQSAYWIYSLLVERRDDFMRAMKDRGIVTSQVHERNDKHSCMREHRTFLPKLDATISRVVSIPVGWWVSPEDRQHIVESIRHGW